MLHIAIGEIKVIIQILSPNMIGEKICNKGIGVLMTITLRDLSQNVQIVILI